MRKTLLICAAVACVAALNVAADAGALPKLETRVRTLAVFKNGLGFVLRSGQTQLADGWAEMSETPPAALGTLWIGTTNPLERVEEVVAYKGAAETERDPQSLGELVDLNVGKELSIWHTTGGSGEGTQVNGKVLASTPQMVLMQASNGKLAIKKDSIQSVWITGDDAVLKAKDSSSDNKAKVHVGGKAKSAEVTMAYLEKGLTWSPSYLVNIRDEKKADITLEAVLANDAEDLEDADVSFVVGYPNFEFADITTPMSLQQSVSAFISALSSGRTNYQNPFSNGIMQQSVMYNSAVYDSQAPAPSYSSARPMAGESNEDLYLYHQPNVTLKKGDRARYTIFSGSIPYEHAYELEVPDSMNVNDQGYRSSDRAGSPDDPQVWHVLRLENTTDHPWTTAPALAVNGSMPVAQDTLKYTPPKGKNTLKLTIATDLRAQQEQIEASREQVTVLRSSYDAVTINGKLTLHSFKDKPVKLTVKKSIVGDVLESSDGGKAVKLGKALTAVNANSQITWDLELAPGAEKALTYSYKVLIYR